MDILLNDPVVILLKKNEKQNYDVITADTMQLNMFESSINIGSIVSPREMTSYDLGKEIKKYIAEGVMSDRQLNNYKIEYYSINLLI